VSAASARELRVWSEPKLKKMRREGGTSDADRDILSHAKTPASLPGFAFTLRKRMSAIYY
jgi:hypothetical protein